MKTSTALPPGAVRPLEIVAGHLALDFANTVDDPYGPGRVDYLASYPLTLIWSSRVGLLTDERAERLDQIATQRPEAAAAALESIHRLRGIIATTFTDLITEPESAERHWTALRPYVVEATTRVELGRSATAFQLTWPDTDDLDAIIWPLAHSAFDLLRSPQLRRLKRCVACPWLFLDGSKNSSRRWCTMNICGTDEKIRRYVSRRAERRKAEH
jgi:predicted RNA-binding Zn ribbon-like protein